jgi:hypothetical protein
VVSPRLCSTWKTLETSELESDVEFALINGMKQRSNGRMWQRDWVKYIQAVWVRGCAAMTHKHLLQARKAPSRVEVLVNKHSRTHDEDMIQGWADGNISPDKKLHP